MADSIEALEYDLRNSRRSLETNLAELNARAEMATDWQTHYRAHVGVALGTALLGGVVVGALTSGRYGAALRSGPVGQVATRAVDALMATGMAAAVDFVSDLIPGFGEEYRARSSSNY